MDSRPRAEMYMGRQNVKAGAGGRGGHTAPSLTEVFETVMLFLMS